MKILQMYPKALDVCEMILSVLLKSDTKTTQDIVKYANLHYIKKETLHAKIF